MRAGSSSTSSAASDVLPLAAMRFCHFATSARGWCMRTSEDSNGLSYYDICGPQWRSALALLAVFAIAACVLFGIVRVPGKSGPDLLDGLICLFFLVLCGYHFGLMRRVRLDKAQGTVSVGRGFLVPISHELYATDEFTSVQLTEVRYINPPLRWTDAPAYFVDLLRPGKPDLRIGACRNYFRSQTRAQAVARLLGIPFTDATRSVSPGGGN
jgi:hypothetical protein